MQFSIDDSTAKVHIPGRSLQLLEVRMTHESSCMNLTSNLIKLILLFFSPRTQLVRESFDSLLYQ